MHEQIAAFPSEQFYDGKLITPSTIMERPTPSWLSPCFPNICFWDTNGRNMQNGSKGHGFANRQEADFITLTLLTSFAHVFLSKADGEVTIGIISFYKDQVRLALRVRIFFACRFGMEYSQILCPIP